MGAKTGIEWTDATWNPIGGCSIKSPGCKHCYAQTLAGTRLKNHPLYAGTTTPAKDGKPVFNGRLTTSEDSDVWAWPLKWKGPKAPVRGPGTRPLVFVGDMSDLFHPDRLLGVIDRVFATMALSPRLDFQILTKRPDIMVKYVMEFGAPDSPIADGRITAAVNAVLCGAAKNWGQCGSTSTSITTANRGSGAREPGMFRRSADGEVRRLIRGDGSDPQDWFSCNQAYLDRLHVPEWAIWEKEFGWGLKEWPLWNAWLGFSAERQAEFDERWEHMKALARMGWIIFVSIEPMLEHITLPDDFLALGRRAQVICGGLSGSDESPLHPAWPRALRDQCQDAGVPFFFKQWGECQPQKAKAVMSSTGPVAWPDGTVCAGTNKDHGGDGIDFIRLGKKTAGRELDGRTWSEFPA